MQDFYFFSAFKKQKNYYKVNHVIPNRGTVKNIEDDKAFTVFI